MHVKLVRQLELWRIEIRELKVSERESKQMKTKRTSVADYVQ